MLHYLHMFKVLLELIELGILLVYLLAGIAKRKHLTYWLAGCGCGCLLYDLMILHGHHSVRMWGALNVPLLIWIAYFSYVKILRKSLPRVAQRLAALCTMLFRG